MKKVETLKNVETLLWASLVLALVGSVYHLAHVFASLDGQDGLGWLQAVSVDAGVFALAYGARNRGGKLVRFGLVLFVVISIYGNLVYGLEHAGREVWYWLEWARPLVLAASLPVLVLFLAELLAGTATGKETVKIRPERVNAPVKRTKTATRKKTGKEANKRKVLAIVKNDPTAGKAEVYRRVGVAKSTGQTYFNELEADGLLVKNGHGWEVIE